MFRKVVLVFEGDRLLGEVELYGNDGALWDELKEVRITKYSPPSDRCPPLAVLHTIKPDNGLCFKMKPLAMNLPENSLLSQLHATCLRDNKAAVASIGAGEIHLVAMRSRKFEGLTPCFWGFNVSSSLYNSCLIMLNLRCLGIVFDLDETLIVANTMRSFEDRIEALQRKLSSESDPQRVSGMLAEVKRYQDDKNILKQYAENDQVIDNGKIIKAQSEMVPALSDSHQPIFRPLIRFQDRNIILTRINPSIRDTSVLVRLRPGWEELRSYLTARGRKRFEVFVCTMAERDYALEMWRLLDPESNLISTRELLERIVCVKSGLKKSLFNVFQEGNCHPKMALVIDDRLKVWDEKDQPRVHVVPAFAPYYAPQAEAGNTIPALCVARNMACNVRGGFFKEFDEGLLQQIPGVAYEDDIRDVPPSPDVSNYLVSEDDTTTSSANKDSGFDGMADVEVERRLKEALAAASTASQSMINIDPRIASALQYVMAQSSAFAVPQPTVSGPTMSFPSQQVTQVAALLKPLLPQIGQGERIVQSSPAREEGEVPESELDPDTRRRLLILQHGQDLREPSPSESQIPSVHPPMQVPVSRSQPRVWFPGEEEMSTGQLNRAAQSMQPKEFITPLNVEPLPIDKHRALHPPFPQPEVPVPPVRVLPEIRRLPKEALPREEQLRLNNPMPDFPSFSGEDVSAAQLSPGNKDLDLEVGQIEDTYADSSVGVLQDIATRCGTKVEFKQALISSTELQFFVEVLFAGEKISEGTGRTRREAHRQASDRSLLYLAEKYLTQLRPDSSHVPVDGSRSATQKYNGFVNSVNSFAYQSPPKEARFPPISAPTRLTDPRTEASRKTEGSINALKELCATEGLGVAFQTQPHFSSNPGQKNEVYAQVEINGQVLGKGIGVTWEEAKSQAADKALVALKSMLSQFPHQQQGSPRSFHGMPNKRFKPEFPRGPPRTPSSARYPRNASPIP